MEHLSFKSASWKERTAAARREFLEWTEPRQMPGKVQYGEIIRWLSDHLPQDTIVAGGAGNFAGWLHRHFRYKGFPTHLGSPNAPPCLAFSAPLTPKRPSPLRTD